jgi:hypothetical protein
LLFFLHEFFLASVKPCRRLAWHFSARSKTTISSTRDVADLWLEGALFHFLLKPLLFSHDHTLMSLIFSIFGVAHKPVRTTFIGLSSSLIQFLINPLVNLWQTIFIIFKCLFISHHYSVQSFFWLSFFLYLNVNVFYILRSCFLRLCLLHLHCLRVLPFEVILKVFLIRLFVLLLGNPTLWLFLHIGLVIWLNASQWLVLFHSLLRCRIILSLYEFLFLCRCLVWISLEPVIVNCAFINVIELIIEIIRSITEKLRLFRIFIWWLLLIRLLLLVWSSLLLLLILFFR